MHSSIFFSVATFSLTNKMLFYHINYVLIFLFKLFSMIDMKPPISRAKMMSVTKAAIKAIKVTFPIKKKKKNYIFYTVGVDLLKLNSINVVETVAHEEDSLLE